MNKSKIENHKPNEALNQAYCQTPVIGSPVSEVYNMDCLDYMRKVEDNFFDWAICDIEYGIGASKPSEKPHTVKQKNGTVLKVKQNNYEHSDWDFKKSTPEYFEQLFRVSKKQIISMATIFMLVK